ncbi:MAG: hypothetical protein VB144_13220 [Clostridia bacterium]|nr:hypothetical protein [Clostridia bacterium]
MKRLFVLFAIMALVFVPAMAMAYNPGQELPAGAVEVEHWEMVNGAWVSHPSGDVTSLARCWRSGPTQGSCNKENWVIDFTHHASMAQWSDWTIGGTRWDWRILKPGTYAADCIEFTLKSNNDVLIDYEGFADLQYLETGAGVKRTIDTYYSFGEDIVAAERNGWVRAVDLNTDDDLILDSAALHGGMSTKLLNKIVVENCNSSCEYEDTATITLKLQNIKLWVDGVNGTWANPQV